MKTVIWRQQNSDGSISVFYSDGSFVKVDPISGSIVARDDSPNPIRAAAFQSGDTSAIKQVQDDVNRENTRRWDADALRRDRALDQQADELSNNYRVAMMNARTNADAQRATREYQQGQLQLQRERLALDREIQQSQLAYGLIETGARLHNNPLDYFNEAEWSRGVAGRPETSTFLSALQNNTRLADFNARGAPAEVNSLGALTAKLAGSGGADNSGNFLAQIGNIAAKGPHQLGAGGLEQLTPTERSLFTGGLSKLGYDPDTFLAGYARSRIGQSAGLSRAA